MTLPSTTVAFPLVEGNASMATEPGRVVLEIVCRGELDAIESVIALFSQHADGQALLAHMKVGQ